eukprot:1147317-Pelagomonas_calceolata.AAC.2
MLPAPARMQSSDCASQGIRHPSWGCPASSPQEKHAATAAGGGDGAAAAAAAASVLWWKSVAALIPRGYAGPNSGERALRGHSPLMNTNGSA